MQYDTKDIKINSITSIANNGFDVEWNVKGIGFGHISFYYIRDKIRCDNECMSKEFIKDILNAMVNQAILADK